jgi:fructose-bisphosphate aldolase class II
MKPATEYLKKAQQEGWALPHFNFSTIDVLRAIIATAAKLKSPVFVATSEGEREFFGARQAVSAVETLREQYQIPIFLNADHTKSWELAKEAIDIGYDAVLIDASKLDYDENINLTKKVVDYAKGKNRKIIVEGELGYLRGRSTIQKTIEIKEEDLTKPDEAREFVSQTKIDLLAPVVGNIHGIITEGEEKLRLELIKKIKQSVGEVGLVLHGASGLKDEEIISAIKAGISVIHFNTELRFVYTQALKKFITENSDEIVPYKYLSSAAQAVSQIVEKKINLFGSISRI